jgi:hypothetical protein
MDDLVEKCWVQGWWCVRGGKNHVKCYPPNDECGAQAPGAQGVVCIPTPWRANDTLNR